GFARGDRVAIIGDNRPQLYWAVMATQALGGVPVPIYQDSIEKEVEFVVDHAEARFAVVEDQEQVDKLLNVKARCPRLQHVVCDHIFSSAQAIITGFAINCPESAATVLHDLKEIAPTYFFGPPRIWESILTSVMVRVEDAVWVKRATVQLFLRLAQDIERRRLGRQPVALWQRLLYPLGNLLVYGPLKDNLGLRRVRRAYTAGEAIGPEIFLFFRGLGVNVKQLYGMTEASVFVTIQRDGDVR